MLPFDLSPLGDGLATLHSAQVDANQNPKRTQIATAETVRAPSASSKHANVQVETVPHDASLD